MNQDSIGPTGRAVIFLDEAKTAPYELMRSLFIISSSTPEAFVKEKNLPQSAISVIQNDNWEGIRESFRDKNPDSMKTLAALMTDSSVVLEMEIYSLKMAQLQDEVNFIKAHYLKWGDYYARSPDEEILINHKGQPIPLTIPSSTGDLMARKTHYELIMNYLKILDSIDNLQKRLAGQVIELSIEGKKENIEFAGFLESKKSE